MCKPLASQSPEGAGRAIAALAGDPELLSLTGQALSVKTLAARYGVGVVRLAAEAFGVNPG